MDKYSLIMLPATATSSMNIALNVNKKAGMYSNVNHSAKIIAEALSNCVAVYTPRDFPKGTEQGMDIKPFL